MRQAQTTILERIRDFEQDFVTEPFETSWASEATLFVIRHEAAHAGDYLEVAPQISADGINFCDADDALIMRGDDAVKFIPLRHFAGALRFSCRLSHGARFKLTLQLHLKE
jgi:hypothetical protein